ncbi:hypothetical protein DFJ58DRAFT_129893 [Suillus subalutaceus]|uniref:uncharacterized protein n=1 Tax=Suillus subalutaceus TaxID=48586 RepID=UPI001B879199|nr:uncharacterized protein DFJ58DRAFT_129893 [Suillus subalutaceus]KAG1867256.1 hypothetical protein DFJ58DRAFT_129893 [Suillus subalutaceus]
MSSDLYVQVGALLLAVSPAEFLGLLKKVRSKPQIAAPSFGCTFWIYHWHIWICALALGSCSVICWISDSTFQSAAGHGLPLHPFNIGCYIAGTFGSAYWPGPGILLGHLLDLNFISHGTHLEASFLRRSIGTDTDIARFTL